MKRRSGPKKRRKEDGALACCNGGGWGGWSLKGRAGFNCLVGKSTRTGQGVASDCKGAGRNKAPLRRKARREKSYGGKGAFAQERSGAFGPERDMAVIQSKGEGGGVGIISRRFSKMILSSSPFRKA